MEDDIKVVKDFLSAVEWLLETVPGTWRHQRISKQIDAAKASLDRLEDFIISGTGS